MLKNKIKISVMLVAILLILSNVCFAVTVSSEKAKLEIVENNICNIKINEYNIISDIVNFGIFRSKS